MPKTPTPPKAISPWQRAATGTEHGEQSALFSWAAMAAARGFEAAWNPESYVNGPIWLDETYGPWNGPQAEPLAALMFAIHNQGHGDVIRGAIAKAEGVKAGVPDVMLPVTTKSFAGLFIEMKRRKSQRGAKGRTHGQQESWIDRLRSQHYKVEVWHTWHEAARAVQDYIQQAKGLG